MWNYNNTSELMHYGVKGMKWGVRRYQNEDGSLTKQGKYRARHLRGHAGPGQYATRKRQLAGDKRDLDYLNKGGHLSVGLTKKRQAAYDKKDKARLEKRIAKNEAKIKAKAEKKEFKSYVNAMYKTGGRDSINDVSNGRQGTALYNEIRAKKGKEYADKVEQEMNNKALRTIAASSAVTVGSIVASQYMLYRFIR